jgi:hypothetical protein
MENIFSKMFGKSTEATTGRAYLLDTAATMIDRNGNIIRAGDTVIYYDIAWYTGKPMFATVLGQCSANGIPEVWLKFDEKLDIEIWPNNEGMGTFRLTEKATREEFESVKNTPDITRQFACHKCHETVACVLKYEGKRYFNTDNEEVKVYFGDVICSKGHTSTMRFDIKS